MYKLLSIAAMLATTAPGAWSAGAGPSTLASTMTSTMAPVMTPALARPTVPAATPDVGQVSLLIGQAWVARADGTQTALARGSAIRVGDRVETAANGHVHMRFIDNAAVSVRPDSVLQVQSYHFDVANPQANEVRLRLEKGASRSISGAATDLDKTRFRLNTPIAAIGVRGTDFIVQTDAAGMRATVSDGTIVVSALGGSCSAAGLGPCAGNDVRELSAEMGRLMAEVRLGDRATRIVPAADFSPAMVTAHHDASAVQRPMSMSAARAAGLLAAEPTALEAQRGNDRAAASLLTLAAIAAPDTAGPPTVPVVNTPDSPIAPTLPVVNPPTPTNPVTLPTTNPVTLPAVNPVDSGAALLARRSDTSEQLVWGRWGISPGEHDKISLPFSLAVLDRHVTVADEQMGLFRANQTVPGPLFPDTNAGKVEFRINSASVSYELGSRVEKAAVTASNLTIDFSRRTFATGLDLASVSGTKGELRMAGDVRVDGIFAVRDVDQRVAGAISLDGKEVGYLFERSAGDGLFRGRTLWGK